MPQSDALARPTSRRRSLALAIAPAIVVLLLVAALLWSLRTQSRSRALVGQTRMVIIATEHAMSTLKDAETGQRGYLLTGADEYLAPYKSAIDSMRLDTARLRALARDNPDRQRHLDSLGVLLRPRLAELQQTIDLKRAGNGAAAMRVMAGGSGKHSMDAIRALMGEMQNEEWRQLALRDRAEQALSRFTLWLLILGGLGTVAISYYLSRLLASHSRTMEAQAALIGEQNKSLKEQMVELEEQTTDMEEQQVELETTNEHLVERTREAEEAGTRAREAVEIKSRFLATMSHELRTPLNAILGYTDLIASGMEDPRANTDRSYIARTRSAARHLLSLIDDVLAIARSESRDVKPVLEAVRLGDVVQDVVSVITPLAEQKKLALEVHCDIDGQRVMIDRRRVRQILINVLGNAVKFTKDGRIRLNVDCRDSTVTFRMRDSGPGIPKEHLERIFEPFWQAPDGGGRSAGGVGLGLAVSRQLARAMNGELRVESAVGQGAEFTLTLPFTDAEN